jgi:hypothetical protein
VINYGLSRLCIKRRHSVSGAAIAAPGFFERGWCAVNDAQNIGVTQNQKTVSEENGTKQPSMWTVVLHFHPASWKLQDCDVSANQRADYYSGAPETFRGCHSWMSAELGASGQISSKPTSGPE